VNTLGVVGFQIVRGWFLLGDAAWQVFGALSMSGFSTYMNCWGPRRAKVCGCVSLAPHVRGVWLWTDAKTTEEKDAVVLAEKKAVVVV
jgi:hypothetical protein